VVTYNGAARTGGFVGRVVLLAVVVGAIAALLSVLVLPAAVAVTRSVNLVNSQLLDIPPLPDGELSALAENSVVLAGDGSFLAELHAEENRVAVDLSEIPTITQNAILATEDAEFYRHRGVNHQAILRAALRNIEAGEIEGGGSTITQQLVKNTLLTHAQTYDRKIQEAVWAIELERRFTKQEIFEAYLNTVYFGRGVYGIGTAAGFYFSKDVSELNASESALLAGIIRSPERNNPVNHPQAAEARRNIVLRQMANQGFITPADAEAAINRPIALSIREVAGPREPFYVEWVKQMLLNEEMSVQPEATRILGETNEERRRAVFEGGLVIHTTLNPEFQDLAEETLRGFLDDPIESPLGSLVTIDTKTGAVVAMAVGPKEFGTCDDPDEPCPLTKVNPVVYGVGGSGRQTGSAFKPIVLAAALEEGFTPGYAAETTSGQVIENCGWNEPYAPNNFAGSGGGYMEMPQAIRVSNNVYHVKLARDAGVTNVRDMGIRLGLENSPNLPNFGELDCAIGLGSADVYPVEFASVYATFANRGVRCPPFTITKIEDRHGNLLYSHRETCTQVIDRGIADRINELLRGPVGSGGTAGFISGLLGRPVAGKTGTTNDFKDAWFVGYVPQYSTVAWVGYEIPRELYNVTAGGTTYARVTGGSIPARMWGQYMAALLTDVPVERFAQPPPIPTATVPDVLGLMVEEALAILEERGFKPRVETIEHHYPEGTVIAQTPDGGGSAWVGSAVVLHVSDGEGEAPLVEVPDLLGMSEEEARETLEELGLRVHVVRKRTSDLSEDGIVIEQSPEPGTEVEPGERVVIGVGQHRGDDDGDDDTGDDGSGDDGEDDTDGGDGGGPGSGRGPPGDDGNGA
jgi:penicillin-binding protein 1A